MKNIKYLFLISAFIISCSDETIDESPVEELPVELGTFEVALGSIITNDTSKVSAIANLSILGNIKSFSKYGFIVTNNQGISDTVIAGQNQLITSFSSVISELNRNTNYELRAFAIENTLGIKTSESQNFSTKAFVLDSITPGQALPQESIILHGKGFSDFDIDTPIYLIKRNGSDSIKANVLTKGDNFLSITYDDLENEVFFANSGSECSKISFTYNTFYYSSNDNVCIYTYKPIINSVEKDTIKIGERLKVSGSFGNSIVGVEVFLDNEPLPKITPSGVNVAILMGSVNNGKKYHRIYRIEIWFIDGVNPGTYTLNIKVGDFILSAKNKITIIE